MNFRDQRLGVVNNINPAECKYAMEFCFVIEICCGVVDFCGVIIEVIDDRSLNKVKI